MPHRSGETGFKTTSFTCRKPHVVVTERFSDGRLGRQLVKQLPDDYAFPDCLDVCVATRDELLVESDAEQFSIEVSMRTAKGAACEHEGGDYVCGGGFGRNYNAKLQDREKNLGTWLLDFFKQADAKLAATGSQRRAVTFQEFHDVLEIMRRGLAAWFTVKRLKLFNVPKKTPVLAVGFNDMLIKTLALSQFESIGRYRSFCDTTTKLDENMKFEIQWAAICEYAQLPHKPVAYVCKNKIAEMRREQQAILSQLKQEKKKKKEKEKKKQKDKDLSSEVPALHGSTTATTSNPSTNASSTSSGKFVKSSSALNSNECTPLVDANTSHGAGSGGQAPKHKADKGHCGCCIVM